MCPSFTMLSSMRQVWRAVGHTHTRARAHMHARTAHSTVSTRVLTFELAGTTTFPAEKVSTCRCVCARAPVVGVGVWGGVWVWVDLFG